MKQGVFSKEPGVVSSPHRSTFLEVEKTKKADGVILPSKGVFSEGESSDRNCLAASGTFPLQSGPDLSDFAGFPPLSRGLEDVVASCGLNERQPSK